MEEDSENKLVSWKIKFIFGAVIVSLFAVEVGALYEHAPMNDHTGPCKVIDCHQDHTEESIFNGAVSGISPSGTMDYTDLNIPS
ncbi:MAG: hypothetical protein H6760_01470 [Candidatus Nomurabacteria bacterium]|nr:MAG: hypothetical protein H6760_01470 [Candidatus Nomurabacteria bacterium]